MKTLSGFADMTMLENPRDKNPDSMGTFSDDRDWPESLADKMRWKRLPNKCSFFLFYSE
jgi:hypothetical protein